MDGVTDIHTYTDFVALAAEHGYAHIQLTHVKTKCIIKTIRQLLEFIGELASRDKTCVVSIMMDYLIHPDRRWFLYAHTRFLHTVECKLHEFYAHEQAHFKHNELIRWLTILYADVKLRPHLMRTSVYKLSTATLLGVEGPHTPCLCLDVDYEYIESDEPVTCVVCGESGGNLQKKQSTKESEDTVFERAKQILARRLEPGYDARAAYEAAFDQDSSVPPWFLAVEYYQHDGTLGPFENAHYTMDGR